jgi:glycosyltransferase involved in cell wall biosynthesis
MISIIIPTLNEEGVIGERLQSLKSHLHIPHEIVVSDGNSKDKTAAIARQYADKVFVHGGPERQTIAGGRNAGAAAATGDILFHTDADVIVPDMDAFFTEVLKEFDDPKVVAVTTRLRIYPEEERFDDMIAHLIFNSSIRFANHFGSFLAKGECQIVRASAFRQVGGYNEHVVVGEDGDLFYRLAKIGKIVYRNDLVVYHSPRRFRKTGYVKLLWSYAREGYSLFFLGKSHLKELKPERY